MTISTTEYIFYSFIGLLVIAIIHNLDKYFKEKALQGNLIQVVFNLLVYLLDAFWHIL